MIRIKPDAAVSAVTIIRTGSIANWITAAAAVVTVGVVTYTAKKIIDFITSEDVVEVEPEETMFEKNKRAIAREEQVIGLDDRPCLLPEKGPAYPTIEEAKAGTAGAGLRGYDISDHITVELEGGYGVILPNQKRPIYGKPEAKVVKNTKRLAGRLRSSIQKKISAKIADEVFRGFSSKHQAKTGKKS